MRIAVCVKQTYDPATVKISRSREEFDLRGAVKITNPSDKYALEAALRLREAAGGEVIALTAGDADAEEAAREAVAMGADRATLITGPELAAAGGRAVARALAAGVRRLADEHAAPIDLVVTGQAGLTDGTGTLAPRLAAELGWPVALDALSLAVTPAGEIEATVAAGDGVAEIITLAPPAVIAIAAGAERPRYPHPARIANAWAPGLVEICAVQELGLTAEALAPDSAPGSLILPPERTRGQVIGGMVKAAAEELVGVLRSKRII